MMRRVRQRRRSGIEPLMDQAPIMHPEIFRTLFPPRSYPDWIEERLAEGYTAEDTAAEIVDFYAMAHDHPIRATYQTLKLPWIAAHFGPPNEVARLVELVVHADRAPAPNMHLARDWGEDEGPIPWVPPCGIAGGCTSRSCRALTRRVYVFARAVRIAEGVPGAAFHAAANAPAAAEMGLDARACERMETYLTPAVREKFVQDMYIHMDAHIAAVVRITDEAEEEGHLPGACHEDLIAACLEDAPISIQGSYCEVDAPMMEVFIPMALVYGISPKKRQIPQSHYPYVNTFNHTIIEIFIILARKPQPVRCISRELERVILNNSAHCPPVAVFFIKFVMATLLGVYRHCEIRPPFHQRIGLYRAFLCEIVITEVLDVLTESRKNTILYSLRELFGFALSKLPEVREAFYEVLNIEQYDRFNTIVTERIREGAVQAMDDGVVDFGEILARAEKTIARPHSHARRFQAERTLSPNTPREILAVIDAFCWESYKPDDHPPPVQPDRADCEWRLETRNVFPADSCPSLPPEEEAVIRKIFSLYPEGEMATPAWLALFGMDAAVIESAARAMTGNRPALARAFGDMSARDRALFYMYVRVGCEHMLCRTYRGDALMAYVHATAAQRIFKINPGAPIPVVAGSVFVCKNCHAVKQASVYPSEHRNKTTKGYSSCMLCFDGRVHCARLPATISRASQRSQVPEDLRLPSTEEPKKAPALNQRSQNRNAGKKAHTAAVHMRCVDTELTRMDALGRFGRFDTRFLVSCFRCLCTTDKATTAFVGDEILCSVCASKVVKELWEPRRCAIPQCRHMVQPLNATEHTIIDDSAPGGAVLRKVYFCNTDEYSLRMQSRTTTPLLSDLTAGHSVIVSRLGGGGGGVPPPSTPLRS